MHVVTVTAKRLTAQEKQLSLLEERQAQLRPAWQQHRQHPVSGA